MIAFDPERRRDAIVQGDDNFCRRATRGTRIIKENSAERLDGPG